MKVVVIGDVGPKSNEFHVGDEAMAEALISELSARDVSVSALISAQPTESSARYNLPSLSRLGFDDESTPTRAAREARLMQVLAAAHSGGGLDAADPAAQVIAAISESDGLVISGGGNLSSLWPEHVYERNAAVAIATVLGKPVVVSGQTLGPALGERDGQLVAELLDRASLVGIRERDSMGVARDLGINESKLRLTLDDAVWLEGGAPPTGLPAEYCVVTVAPYAGLIPAELLADALAGLLDRVVITTGLDIVFVPHLGTLSGAGTADQLVHDLIVQRMTSDRVQMLGVLTSRQVAAVTRGAQLSISTRYHPAVFASTAGVPTVAFSVDEYTNLKLRGALEHLGLDELVVPSSALAAGQADAVVAAAWKNRARIRKHVAALETSLRAASSAWWDDVVAVIAGSPPTSGDLDRVERLTLLPADLVASAAVQTEWQRVGSASIIADRIGRDERHLVSDGASEEVLELERRLGATEAALSDFVQRVEHAEVALEASRTLLAEVADPLFEARLGDERISAPSTELEALLNTRTFRWTAGARRVYGRGRRFAGRLVRPFRR